MPEIIEISGLDDTNGEDKSWITIVLLFAVLAVTTFLLSVRRRKTEQGLGDFGIIKECRPQDKKPDRPRREQKWCLWDSKGMRIIGRHPSRSRALRQERLIHARRHR
jgi:hypothetical protein